MRRTFNQTAQSPSALARNRQAAAVAATLAFIALAGTSIVVDQLTAPADAPLPGQQASADVHQGEEDVFLGVSKPKMTIESARQEFDRTANSLSDQQNRAQWQTVLPERLSQAPSIAVARPGAQVDHHEQHLPLPTAVARISAPEDRPTITGTDPIPQKTQSRKDKGRPGHVEGWVLRDVNDGLAVVQSPTAGLFGVRVGNTVPGVGRVEKVERRGKNWVVVTNAGTIVAAR
jgi:hypothetical protein